MYNVHCHIPMRCMRTCTFVCVLCICVCMKEDMFALHMTAKGHQTSSTPKINGPDRAELFGVRPSRQGKESAHRKAEACDAPRSHQDIEERAGVPSLPANQ